MSLFMHGVAVHLIKPKELKPKEFTTIWNLISLDLKRPCEI